MNRMKRLISVVICIVLVCNLTGCASRGQEMEVFIPDTEIVPQEISRVTKYKTVIPPDYEYYDYKTTALKFDEVVFNMQAEGPFLPLIWEDTTHDSFGLSAYAGDGRMNKDGAQEAVTLIASVLSATQLGIDKSNQNGVNYVKMLNAFFSEEEKIVLNNPGAKSADTSMWYMLYPAILFAQVSILYPDEAELREQTLATIESWYQAYQIMSQEESFNYTGFDFAKMEPYQNGEWTEPDCAAGIGLLLYYGYELTGRQDYLDAAIDAISYLNERKKSQQYEVLFYFAPYLGVMFNARYGADIDVGKMLDHMLSGKSMPRNGWGSLVATSGDYCLNGLMGSTMDSGGYAFSMNSFAAAYALAPLAKYSPDYASAIGKWYLNVVSNARYFFADQVGEENQSKTGNEAAESFAIATGYAIPYEGIRKEFESKSPWVGGDPTVYGWAETDFSLYSGAHTGLMGAVVEATDVPAILKIDLNRADLFHQGAPSYLMYNPYEEAKTVTYTVTGDKKVDLYDVITKQYLAQKITGTVNLSVPADGSVVIVEVPAGKKIK